MVSFDQWKLSRMQVRWWNAVLFTAAALFLLTSGCASLHSSRTDGVTGDRQLVSMGTIDPHTQAEACRRTGEELARNDKDEHAISQLEHAREFDPRMKGIAHSLAVLYDRQGRIDAAEREYRKALVESPNNADVLNDYGYFLYSQGSLSEAESQLRHALKLKPEHAQAQVNLGMALAGQQRFEEAFKVFERALGPAAAHHNLGLLLARAGRQDEAKTHLRQATKRDPSLTRTQRVLTALDESSSSTQELVVPASHEQSEPAR